MHGAAADEIQRILATVHDRNIASDRRALQVAPDQFALSAIVVNHQNRD
jgi:hypothetical protein